MPEKQFASRTAKRPAKPVAAKRPGSPVAVALALAVVVPLGLFLEYAYRGPGRTWVRAHGTGVLYEVFFVLAFALVLPRARPLSIAAWVLAATSFLELLQLWHPPWLQAFRRTLAGRALIGVGFDGWDFPHYVAGCALGAWLVARLAGRPREAARRAGEG